MYRSSEVFESPLYSILSKVIGLNVFVQHPWESAMHVLGRASDEQAARCFHLEEWLWFGL